MGAVAVIGGGAGGIAAALCAAQNGREVILIEAGRRLGGRLTTGIDRRTGYRFDNGEHLILAGYKDTLKLLKALGAEDAVELQPRLKIPFYHPEKGVCEFKAPAIPLTFSFPAAISKFKLLSFRDRLALMRRLTRLVKGDAPESFSAARWLQGASAEELDYFWQPFIVSVMNCLPAEADIGLVRTALTEGFISGGGLGFFTEPLSEIFHRRARAKLQEAGVEVRLNHPVTEVSFSGSRARSLKGRFKGEIAADGFIIAVPPRALSRMTLNGRQPSDIGIIEADFRYSTICSVFIVFEERIFPGDFGCLTGTLPQWFFRLKGGRKPAEGEAYNLVISAADKFLLQEENILDRCLSDLRKLGADLDHNQTLCQRVMVNRRATVILNPETAKRRPGIKTGWDNVFLAGDWVDTGLPATIESAVRSGFRAGEMVCA